MKRLIFITFILLSSCSFDNKTGIWSNNDNTISRKNNKFKDFKILNTEQKTFNEEVEPLSNFKPIIDPVKINLKWLDEHYRGSNNIDNFTYKDLNEIIFKSKKLSRYNVSNKILFDGDNIFINDQKGNIINYSVEKQKIVYKYNFYNKNFKKIKKNLKMIIDKNVIYIVDNIGYLYALDYQKEKLLWAQNYKIPFRSNIKITKNYLLAADQNNALYIINKKDGIRERFIPTEEKILKNKFINSLALSESSFLFLNTYGSLYSLNKSTARINWFLNLNQSLNLDGSSLFDSKEIIIHKKKIIISTNPFLFILDSDNGAILSKIPIRSIIRPIVSGQNIFLITENNLLVCLNINTGKINYSFNIGNKIAEFLNTKKKSINIKFLSLVNENLFIFLDNSYVVKFYTNGSIKKIDKLPVNMKTSPIFINDSILYLDKKNKLIILN